MKYQPSVVIGSRTIPSTWDERTSTLVAVTPLRIEWGSDAWLEESDPATLTVSIVDRVGDYATANALNGEEIKVIVGTLTIFRGIISDVAVSIGHRTSPLTGAQETYFLLRVVADDHQATAAAAKGYAPVLTEAWRDYVDASGNVGEWVAGDRLFKQATAGVRQADLRVVFAELGAASDVGYPVPIPDGVTYAHAIVADASLSPWDVYKNVVATWPLGRAFYNPASHQMSYVVPNFKPGISIRRADGGIVFDFKPYAGQYAWADSYAVYSVPAKFLEYSDEPELTSTVSQAIDSVKLTVPFKKYISDNSQSVHVGIVDYNVQRNVGRRPSGRLTKKTLEWKTDLINSNIGSSYVDLTKDLFPRLTTTLAFSNDRFAAPAFRYRFDGPLGGLPKAVEDLLIRPYPSRAAFVFNGAEFNALPNTGPGYQIIGGTLEWDSEAGWTGIYRSAPMPGVDDVPLTIDQLFGKSTIPLSEIDISFNDMALPQIGLTT